MTPAELLAKADRAAKSAELLLSVKDTEGACNRAYYAMYDAARAALFAANSPIDPNTIRTHNGVIAAFGLHIVKPGHIPIEYGRSLNRAQDIRQMADYTGEEVTSDLAAWVVAQAYLFIQVIRTAFHFGIPSSEAPHIQKPSP